MGLTCAIQENGIFQFYVGERKISQDSSERFIVAEGADILGPEVRTMAEFGALDERHIVKGSYGIYGIDVQKKVFWKAEMASGMSGGTYLTAKDLGQEHNIQDELTFILGDSSSTDIKSKIDFDNASIVTGYDLKTKEVHFTFKIDHESVEYSNAFLVSKKDDLGSEDYIYSIFCYQHGLTVGDTYKFWEEVNNDWSTVESLEVIDTNYLEIIAAEDVDTIPLIVKDVTINRTLIFSETYNKVFADRSYKPSMYASINEMFLSVPTASLYKAYSHNVGESNNFFGVEYPSIFSFVVVGIMSEGSASSMHKIFDSISLEMPQEQPVSVCYHTDYQVGYNDFTDDNVDAEYWDRHWLFPIAPAIADTLSQESNANMAGTFLKVSVEIQPLVTFNPIWIRKAKTNFQII
jgi:hypothetical protein